jgi:prolyl-tRNA synthetase
MKDSYSFHISKECALQTYEIMLQCYLNIYTRLGLTAIPVSANTGDIGGDYSHEFHILADTGESTIYYEAELEHKIKNEKMTLASLDNLYAMEEERHDPASCKIPQEKILSRKGIEVGHIFYLGDKYTKAMNMRVQDKEGSLQYPKMGCYGIGVSRIVGALIEANHDSSGISLPASVAPFKVMILNLKVGNEICDQYANELCSLMNNLGIDYLYDDTDESAGAKFARADLIGIPYQVIIGMKNAQNGQVEFKKRKDRSTELLAINEIKNLISSI